jgi:hypothetical protein
LIKNFLALNSILTIDRQSYMDFAISKQIGYDGS